MSKKSKKKRSLEFPPREDPAGKPEIKDNTDEVVEYEAMGVNSRHHSGVQIDNITEVVTTETEG